jgi:hypothetical protein
MRWRLARAFLINVIRFDARSDPDAPVIGQKSQVRAQFCGKFVTKRGEKAAAI